jgi:hypothetical protein
VKTQVQKVTVIYDTLGEIVGIIKRDDKARVPVFYKCVPMTEEEIADVIDADETKK